MQFQWVKHRYPDVYRRMKIYAAEGKIFCEKIAHTNVKALNLSQVVMIIVNGISL